MFRWLIMAFVITLTLVLSAGQGQVSAQASSPGDSADDADNDGDVDGEILVKFKPSTSRAAKDETHRQQGGRVKENLRKPGSRVAPDIQVVEVSPGDEETKSKEYKRDKKVEYAEPNFIYQPSVTTANDPDFAKLYGLDNTGQTVNNVSGTLDADIDAPEAWDATTGLPGTVVAVIDTGVDVSHPDLKNNIWTNPGETAGDGIDNDSNGYVDDVNGWDFFRNENTVFDAADGDAHGTHVAGTIAAEGNNRDAQNNYVGVVGVNWKAQIMPLKFLGPNGGSTANAIKALDYAVKEGAKISNNSWGGGSFSQALKDALINADSAGHLFVTAAGNGGADQVGDNNDSYPSYPASYDNQNVVSVAATDSKDALASFSNYGATSVDLAAPGIYTYSTLPGNTYGYKSGTSMATPHVTGVAALIKSKYSTLDDAGIKAKLLQSVDKVSSLSSKVASGGRLNAARPLEIEPPDVTPPTVTTTSPASGASGVARNTSVTVTFSEAVDPKTLVTTPTDPADPNVGTSTNFTLVKDGTTTLVDATVTVSPDGKEATLVPKSPPLNSRTTYRATVKGGANGVKDVTQNALASDKSWTFKTTR
jgi:thermitase